MSESLKPDKALIFRIVHRDSVPAALRDGMHCRNSRIANENFVQIGNPELIERRRSRVVDCPPGGTLSDYVPFYFTPFSPMMYNIKTGFQGITKRPNDEILMFVSSLHKLHSEGVKFLFSDRQAYLKLARFTDDLGNLDWLDWVSLQARNFRRDDLDRFERYQAEALVYRHMPMSAMLGVVCHSDSVRQHMQKQLSACGLNLRVITKGGWYF